MIEHKLVEVKPISTQPQKAKLKKSSPDEFDEVTFNDEELNSPLFNSMNVNCQTIGNNFIDDAEELINHMTGSLLVEMKAKSFPLVNQREELLVKDEKDFIDQLNCSEGSQVKVVSIFGNTGDGKSHTLNHTFFNGEPVFKTSSHQNACTIGVWAAYDDLHGAIILDTEGLLGVSANHNQRTRLLLKILAISDVVIYRTRAERLHSDLFQFLGDASQAYLRHFIIQLTAASKRLHLDSNAYTSLGPSLTIFHETLHTDILAKGATEPAEKFIRDRFHEMNLSCNAFSSIHYVGTKTSRGPTNFSGLLVSVKKQLLNNEVRCSRRPAVVFQTLKILNDRFAGSIDQEIPNMFPDQYFTCRIQCLACHTRCVHTMNHSLDEQPHEAHPNSKCIHQPQYQNTVYTCKACHKRGQTVIVVPKTSASTESAWLSLASYAWSGYVLECINCGVIYRSRQHWYGNPEPEKTVVRTEIHHVWPGGNLVLQGTHNAARRLVDGIHYVSDTIAGVGAGPAKAVSNWMADKIAPPYWELNANIKTCRKCEKLFDEYTAIHHCRSCGKGFCDACSSKKRPVPERNWGMSPVRVCDDCYVLTNVNHFKESDSGVDTSQLMPRMVGEAFGSTVNVLSQIVNYPLEALKDAARPAYWVPDGEIKECCVCKLPLNPSSSLSSAVHHCRACGQGVCGKCSSNQRPVRSRGWDHPVRVCDLCFDRKDL
ncbi:hypothetical protein HELRODRAFT_108518 [Helobdella robusta]|uniref:FYVE-type domain-containing protein n=1 Tax=Helobdella robusta TaxID=6412 RepID=T1EEJ7_HELRO|nr:hypothetical protein HELRODRAFT_108518 [Helobdella robusta]ESN91775.1 hypothetical protein HELRODRAFT_108518 [Helobdella robusta]